jgi:predicted ATP-grasp superfamily ATP-dependent carboligase
MNKPVKMPSVMIIGAHTMGLAVMRSFKELNIERIFLSYDTDDMGRASNLASKVFDSPNPETELDSFRDLLIGLAAKYQGAVIFPASDPALKAVSMIKPELDKFFVVACPDWSIVEMTIDKKKTYEIASKYGVPSPKTLLPHSEAEVEEYAQKAVYPFLVKPTQSHLYFSKFHRKMVLANNMAELLNAYHQAAEAGLEVVLQEYIPGDDTDGVNYNSYSIDGKVVVEFTAKKLRNAPPSLGSPCVVYSSETPEVYDAGRKIIEGLGFYGYACTEFKRDPRDGVYKLMEVNGRHNLSGYLAVRCGLNFPLLHYRHLVFNEIPSQVNYEQGKYWIDFVRDAAYYLPDILKGKYSLREFIKPYISNHVNAIYDIGDIKPFFRRFNSLLCDAIKHKRTL